MPTARRILDAMLRLLRRRRRSHSAAMLRAGAEMSRALSDGMRDPRPLTPAELDRVAAHAAGVVSRSFPDLPDD